MAEPAKDHNNEQTDPKGAKLKQTDDNMITGVLYVKSIYQPPVIVDCHMHIESGNCAPLPFLWEQTPGFLRRSSRGWIEFLAWMKGTLCDVFTFDADEVAVVGTGGKKIEKRRHKFSQTVPVAKKDTYKIGNEFVAKRLEDVYPFMDQKELYEDVPQPIFFSVAMMMDMEYAHLDGYFGLKVYNGIYDKNGKIADYWAPWHDDGIRKIIPAKNHSQIAKDKQTKEEFKKNKEVMMTQGIPGVYCNDDNKNIFVNITGKPLVVPGSERTRYETWEKQQFRTQLAVMKNPLKLFSLYHFDPRRWQVHYRGIDEPFEKVSGPSGLHLGFKMYTAQGYRPWDVERLPVLKQFYKRCCDQEIPILNHCTPQGAPTFDKPEYYKFTHPRDTGAESERKKAAKDSDDYFNVNFVSPDAWEEVLSNFKNLRLCLAHFGGNTETGRKWSKKIIELVKKYPYVYADISSSFGDEKFREFFKTNVFSKSDEFKEKIRKKIIFGTDWYMTLLDQIEYMEFCKKAKKFIDDLDNSLWIYFTQSNPYDFYRLKEVNQVKRIKENIVQKRNTDKIIQEHMKVLSAPEIDKLDLKAEYIMNADKSFKKRLMSK